ncbi:hypothetical protein J5N97_007587 [Dioscorea zingiberensis]|uniref:Uncharacterized protein n=1 Tax=Dioscorea zingiberensis TaxID=325984 RepID=A0A9D5DC98_9LILI|nr:hypothetical protein J5N97_007587 [Dioscorea zingiberensis]
MANIVMLKPIASLLLFLNLCMYIILAAIGGWAINVAIDRGFIIGEDLKLPAYFTPIYFPIGNAATGFFVLFSLIAAVVGAASAITGINHIRVWNSISLASAASSAFTAWSLTLLAMGLACKEIVIERRNVRLRTMEASKSSTILKNREVGFLKRDKDETEVELGDVLKAHNAVISEMLPGGEVVLQSYSLALLAFEGL